jgi:hypothetical protein
MIQPLPLPVAPRSRSFRQSQRGRINLLFFCEVLLISLLAKCHATTSEEDNFLNVYGQPLHSCSSNGMALTGYTRTGYCVDQYDDQGSHHICIDLSSTSSDNNSNNNHNNFCTVTGQSDWCSSQDMPCHKDEDDDNDDGSCSIQNWCVCQWAFASYIEAAGGCDSIQTIVCDSINRQAVAAYQQQQHQEKYATALQCIVDRCVLDYSSDNSGSAYSKASATSSSSSSVGSRWIKQIMFVLLLGMVGLIVSGVAIKRRWNKKELCGRNSAADDTHLLSTDTTKTMM